MRRRKRRKSTSSRITVEAVMVEAAMAVVLLWEDYIPHMEAIVEAIMDITTMGIRSIILGAGAEDMALHLHRIVIK